jgi:hypothetical protein
VLPQEHFTNQRLRIADLFLCDFYVLLVLKPWLLVGAIAIFACGDRPYIMIIASGIFTALIIIIPTIWEYCLPTKIKATISQKLEGVPVIGSRKSGGGVLKKQSGDGLVHLTSMNGSSTEAAWQPNGRDIDASEYGASPRERAGW